MTPAPSSAYAELTRLHSRLHRYGHVASIVGWDRNAMPVEPFDDVRDIQRLLREHGLTEEGVLGFEIMEYRVPVPCSTVTTIRPVRTTNRYGVSPPFGTSVSPASCTRCSE